MGTSERQREHLEDYWAQRNANRSPILDTDLPSSEKDFELAEFDCTLSGFGQNRRGDFELKFSVPFRYREAIFALGDAHGILLHVVAERWRNRDADTA